MTTKPGPDVGTSPEDLARMKASDDNLAGIVAGRRRAAKALLAPDPAPAQAVRDAFAPIENRTRP